MDGDAGEESQATLRKELEDEIARYEEMIALHEAYLARGLGDSSDGDEDRTADHRSSALESFLAEADDAEPPREATLEIEALQQTSSSHASELAVGVAEDLLMPRDYSLAVECVESDAEVTDDKEEQIDLTGLPAERDRSGTGDEKLRSGSADIRSRRVQKIEVIQRNLVEKKGVEVRQDEVVANAIALLGRTVADAMHELGTDEVDASEAKTPDNVRAASAFQEREKENKQVRQRCKERQDDALLSHEREVAHEQAQERRECMTNISPMFCEREEAHVEVQKTQKRDAVASLACYAREQEVAHVQAPQAQRTYNGSANDSLASNGQEVSRRSNRDGGDPPKSPKSKEPDSQVPQVCKRKATDSLETHVQVPCAKRTHSSSEKQQESDRARSSSVIATNSSNGGRPNASNVTGSIFPNDASAIERKVRQRRKELSELEKELKQKIKLSVKLKQEAEVRKRDAKQAARDAKKGGKDLQERKKRRAEKFLAVLEQFRESKLEYEAYQEKVYTLRLIVEQMENSVRTSCL